MTIISEVVSVYGMFVSNRIVSGQKKGKQADRRLSCPATTPLLTYTGGPAFRT